MLRHFPPKVPQKGCSVSVTAWKTSHVTPKAQCPMALSQNFQQWGSSPKNRSPPGARGALITTDGLGVIISKMGITHTLCNLVEKFK